MPYLTLRDIFWSIIVWSHISINLQDMSFSPRNMMHGKYSSDPAFEADIIWTDDYFPAQAEDLRLLNSHLCKFVLTI